MDIEKIKNNPVYTETKMKEKYPPHNLSIIKWHD